MLIRHLIKTGAGIGLPLKSKAIQTPLASFFCIGVHAHLYNGGLYGATFGYQIRLTPQLTGKGQQWLTRKLLDAGLLKPVAAE